jgi:ATP diphosphatase
VSRAAEQLEALLALMARLRAPDGCPWDRQQTFETIAPFTIEEAYEVADAIGRRDPKRLRDELGDLLFQVVFHARMGEEAGSFDFADVAQGIREKLVRRHPHVFAAGISASAPAMDQLHVSWEAQKAQERAAAGDHGVLADVPRALPSLARAAKLSRRAGRVGFDWPSPAAVREKVGEELSEVDEAVGRSHQGDIEEEIGDLLFVIANWARHLGVDPEAALQGAGRKFERRFGQMERAAADRRLSLEQLTAAQWEELWQAAKAIERASDGPDSAAIM